MLNEIILSGEIASEPEKKMSDKGNVWCHFLLRTRKMKKKDGSDMGAPYQNYIPITLFNKSAEDVIEFGKKGTGWLGKGFLVKNSYEKPMKDQFGAATGETQKVTELQVQWLMTEVMGAPKPWDRDSAKGNKESTTKAPVYEDSPF